jgi:hypothetical protein
MCTTPLLLAVMSPNDKSDLNLAIGIIIFMAIIGAGCLFFKLANQRIQREVAEREKQERLESNRKDEPRQRKYEEMLELNRQMRESGTTKEEIDWRWQKYFDETRDPIGPRRIFTILQSVITYEIAEPEKAAEIEGKIKEIVLANPDANLANYERLLGIRIIRIEAPQPAPKKEIKGFSEGFKG